MTINQIFSKHKNAILENKFKKMNAMQKQAIFSINGPLLILAGAGSGKTTVIVNRIAYMLKYGNSYFNDNTDESHYNFIKNIIEQDESQLDDYIIKCYDVLHTLGKEYLVEDITEFVREKGIDV